MAQTVTAFSKKPEAAAPAFASVSAADIIRAPVVQRTIPLDLASLIRPFKRQGRLSLRVERMPQRAKLSAGRNNGDGSWSLASDELEGLAYLVPSNIAGEHELAIRIMSFEDAAASTLKVISFPIPAWTVETEPSEEHHEIERHAESRDSALPSQLGKMQSLFAVRESELIALRQTLEKATAQKAAELAEARAAWEQELQERLSRANTAAKSELEQERNSWRTEQDTRIAQAEAWAQQAIAKERDGGQAQAQQQVAAERKLWQAQAERDKETELQRWRAENAAALSEAEARWKAAEAVRSAAALAEWEQKIARLQADAAQACRKLELTLADALAQPKNTTESDQLRQELAALQTAMAEREQEFSRRQAASEQEQDRRTAEDASRFDAARAEWQQQSARLLAESDAKCRNLETALAGALAQPKDTPESGQLRQDLAALKTALAEREQEFARQQAQDASRFDAARAEWQQQSAHLLSQSQAQCRNLEMALADALARPASAPVPDGGETASAGLRQDLAAAQSALTARDLEFVRVAAEFEQERERWQQAAQASLQAASASWKAEESARLDAATAKTRAQFDDALAAATSRCENAERTLAEARSQAATAINRRDDAYVEGLRKELSTLRKTLVNREVELGHVRAALDQARPLHILRAANMPALAQFRTTGASEEEQPASTAKRTLVRDFILVVCLVAPVLLSYPYLAAYLPDNVRDGIASISGGFLSAGEDRAPAAPVAAPPAVKRPTATVSRSVNMRATPAVTGAILLTLQRGAPVAVLEQRGNWTLVEAAASSSAGKPQQGWVYRTYLKNSDGP